MLWLKEQPAKELQGGPGLKSTLGPQCVAVVIDVKSPRFCPHHEGRLGIERNLLATAHTRRMVAKRKSLQFPRMLAGQWQVTSRALAPQDGMQDD